MGRAGCPTPHKRAYVRYQQVARHQELLAKRAAKKGEPEPSCYWCKCQAWHVTSNKKKDKNETRNP